MTVAIAALRVDDDLDSAWRRVDALLAEGHTAVVLDIAQLTSTLGTVDFLSRLTLEIRRRHVRVRLRRPSPMLAELLDLIYGSDSPLG